jgi:lipopolysaccharide export system protein LptA
MSFEKSALQTIQFANAMGVLAHNHIQGIFMTTKLNFIASAAFLSVLAGCGGGGGDAAPVAGNPVVSASATTNVFADQIGTYASGCVVSSPATGTFGGMSDETTVVISNPTGTDKATVSFQGKRFSGSDKCLASTLSGDITVSGQITQLTATKVIAGTTNRPKTGTAKTVEFRFDSLRLSKGALNGSIPTFGTTAKVGYLIEGTKAYAITQTREADGLGSSFSTTVLTKQ